MSNTMIAQDNLLADGLCTIPDPGECFRKRDQLFVLVLIADPDRRCFALDLAEARRKMETDGCSYANAHSFLFGTRNALLIPPVDYKTAAPRGSRSAFGAEI